MREHCSYYAKKTCSSCELLPLGIESAARKKEATVLTELGGYISPLNTEILPIETLTSAFQSRAKAKFSVSGTSKSPLFGVIDSRLHFTELEECPLHFESINKLIQTLKDLITKYSITPYNLSERTGELKGVIITKSIHCTEGCIKFVLRSEKFIKILKEIIPKIKINHPEFTVFSVNIQPIHQAVLEGEREEILSEATTMWERYGEIDVGFGSKSFIQVTPRIAEKLYSRAAEWVSELKPKESMELYCGAGAFTLSLAQHVEKAIAFELSSDAIAAAKNSAIRNGLTNCLFCVADLNNHCEKFNEFNPNIFVVNPPRRGLSSYIIEVLKIKKAKNIIYSSCNVQTLKRDLGLLENYYKVTHLQCFDMFPLTSHVETLIMLKRID